MNQRIPAFQELKDWCAENCKMGIVWNVKGQASWVSGKKGMKVVAAPTIWMMGPFISLKFAIKVGILSLVFYIWAKSFWKLPSGDHWL